MNEILTRDNFHFYDMTYTKFHHYKDNRNGTPFHFYIYMMKGYCNIVAESQTLHIDEGTLFYIPKNLKYQSYWYGNDEIHFLSFCFRDLFLTEKTKFDLQTIPCDKEIIERFIMVRQDGGEITCKNLSMFYGILADIMPIMKTVTLRNDKKIVEDVKKYILNNLTCNMSDVAKACNISEPYLYRVFKSVTKMTPNDFKQKVLCEKASELLTTTDKSIEEISTTLNFSSSSYFRKILKKHTGLTPRDIRKKSIF